MASNFFNKASLVMVPDAPIDGKLPSVKPEDRSGDFTFSRGSNLAATRVNKDGLIEKGRENLLPRSNSFNSAPWSTSSSDATTGQSGYDGTNDAWLLSKTAINGRAQQNLVITGVQTFSVYAKAGTNTWMNLFINGSVSPSVFFDLQNGVLGSVTASTIEAKIVSVGNGWYRCSATFSTTTSRYRIYVSDGDNDNTGASGNILIQDAQLELGLAATDVIESGATTGKAGLLEDEPRFDYSGGGTCPSLLLEPSRTNLVPYSEYFDAYTKSDTSILTNQAQSPEGLVNASLIAETATNSNHYLGLTSGISVVSGTTYTFSVFIKKGDGASAPDYCQLTFNSAGFGAIYANFNLSNGTIGALSGVTPLISDSTINGFWRCSITATATSTANTGAIVAFTNNNDSLGRLPSYLGNTASDFYAYGFQLEQGSYPTSYIPNHSGTGSVTRGAELCELSTGGVNETEGTFFIDYKDSPNVNALFASSTSHNSITNNIRLSQGQLYIRNGGGNLIIANVTAPDSGKLALKYSTSGVKIFANGVSTPIYESTTSITFDGSIDYVRVGSRVNDAGVEEFKPKQFLIFQEALSDADCITLTT